MMDTAGIIRYNNSIEDEEGNIRWKKRFGNNSLRRRKGFL